MGRKEDPFWKHVEKLEKKRFKCTFCMDDYAGGISRVKSHLSGIEGRGIKICKRVPKDVQRAAYKEIKGASKKRKAPSSSSSDGESDAAADLPPEQDNATGSQPTDGLVKDGACNCTIPSSSRVRKNRGEDPVDDMEREGVQRPAQVADERRRSTSDEVGNFCENVNEDVPAVGNYQDNWYEVFSPGFFNEHPNMANYWRQPFPDDRLAPECQVNAMEHTQRMSTDQMVMQPFMNGRDAIPEDRGNSVENINRPFDGAETDVSQENDGGTMVQEQGIQPFHRVTTPDEPEPSAHQKTSEDVLLTTNLISETFQKNIQNIWDCLMKADVFTIGIYGMGGVGKTLLAFHIYNRLLETSNPCHFVYWVTVLQDFSIYGLQTLVANAAKIDLLNEYDQRKRAAILYKGLTEKQNSVLILDDLWESFDLKEVGIPVEEHRCKLILTSRLLKVCEVMSSGEEKTKIITVVPLSTEEAWNLFLETLGCSVALTPEITQAAEGIVKECAGLPLALETMAVTMKGVDDISTWKNAFEALKESEAVGGDMEDKVFSSLRSSYNHLSSPLQHCFLCCALFPEDHCINRIELIEHLIAVGIIDGRESSNAAHKRGHELLDELESASLLECSIKGEQRYVKMHDLVRDMAIQILRANSKSMVEAGKQLRELPDEENWKDDLVRVSLMYNLIKEIPFGHSPNCPNLSTLLLCHNPDLAWISESFFEKLNGLKILDLSHTDIEGLPDSVSKLVNLTSLLLRGCKRIVRVPSLAELKELKKLDLSMTSIKGIPCGMKLLSNLIHLDLSQTDEMEVFPSAILSRFSKLQYLDLGIKRVKIEEVAKLKKLEFVRCCFSDLQDWNHYILSLEGLCRYCFYLAPDGMFSVKKEASELALQRENEVMIEKVRGVVVLPKDVHILLIRHCHELKSLFCNFLFSLSHPTQLKQLKIWDCGQMEWLHDNLPASLEDLAIRHLWNLSSLLSNNSNINRVIFSNLKSFKICHCPGMKKLFPPQLLQNLRNLEELVVIECVNLVEIIGNGPESSVCSSPTPTSVDCNLPKLKVLFLYSLSELQRICIDGRNLICNSLQQITVECCCKLKRMPISLPFLELNGKLSPPSSLKKITTWPREWWDSVDWRHRNEKDALGPLVEFSRQIPDDL